MNEQSKPIIFCDFDGVLCHDKYWRSLAPDEFEKLQNFLFKNNRELVDEWMRGKYSAEDINKIVAEQIDVPFEKLWNTFVEDCKTMQVSTDLLQKLHALRSRYTVILITSNMDSFSRFTHPALSLEKYFDHIINSFDAGTLKTDNNGDQYALWANTYNVPIKDCIVFDDSKHAYAVFTELGGRAYLVTPEQDLAFHLKSIL